MRDRAGLPAVGSLTYEQAVLMLAVLASSADGQPSPQEERLIRTKLAPVLARLGDDGQRTTLALLRQLVQGIGYDNTLTSIRSALPMPRDRIEAVRLAASVALADGQLAGREASHVADLAVLMGLNEDEFRAALNQPAPVQPAPPAHGPRSPDEAIFMLAVLATSADGVPQDEEARVLDARLAAHLGRLGPDGRRDALARLTDLVHAADFDGALRAISAHVPGSHERIEALHLVARILQADRKVTRHERAHFERVAGILGVPARDVPRLAP